MLVAIRREQEDRAALSDERRTAAAVSVLGERGVAGTARASLGDRSGSWRGLVAHRFGSKAR